MHYYDYNIFPSLSDAVKGRIGSEWRLDLPGAPYNRIYVPLEGDASFRLNETEYIIEPGYAYLIPAGNRIHTYCREYCKLLWIHFYLKSDFTDNFFATFPHRIQRKAITRDFSDMEEILQLRESNSMQDILMRNAIIQRLCASFLKPGKPDAVMPRFAAALRAIDSGDNSLSVAKLAKKCSMSPPYFSALFKKTFGLPPQQYIIRARINAAIPMLMNNSTLDEIADKLGFHDAFHFSKTFKRVIGCSPRQYKTQMHSSKAMP